MLVLRTLYFLALFTLQVLAIYESAPAATYDWASGSNSMFAYPMSQYIDVNGDGLLDVVECYECGSNVGCSPTSVNRIYLNTGCGWVLSTSFAYCSSALVDVMTEEGVAQYLRVSVDAALKLLNSKQIKGVQIEGSWRVHKRSIENYLIGAEYY